MGTNKLGGLETRRKTYSHDKKKEDPERRSTYGASYYLWAQFLHEYLG